MDKTTNIGGAEDRGAPAGAAALAKGLGLLDMIAETPKPLRFADLQKLSGMPKPTLARMLKTLIVFRLVRQDEATGAYLLGHRFLELSHRVWDKFDLVSASIPELDRLSADLGETVALCRLDGSRAVYLEERSGDGLGVLIDVGRRVPIHCTAAGKALLAFQEPAFARSLVAQILFDRFTPSTITDPQSLQADLTLTRARGYAVSQEEHLVGVNSVAAPIAGRDGVPLGALVALGPASRLDPSGIHPMGRELMAAARRITGTVGAVAISSGPRPRPQTSSHSDVQCVLPWGAQLGEAPVWVETERKIYWVDILHPAVHRFDPTTGKNESSNVAKLVSAVVPARNGGLIVASQDGIERFDFASGVFSAFAEPEPGMTENRLNDAKTDPAGRLWVGSMRLDASRAGGSLYRIAGNVPTRIESGFTVANGLGWSPDGGTFYFVDTVPGAIYAYDYAPVTGSISNRRLFAELDESEGRPDGLTVDAEGGVWCAIWDGWRVNRYLPDGKLDRVIDLPVPRPTSVAFGGDDLATLFITSARTRLPASTLAEAPLSGGIFACTPGERGLPTTNFDG
ncbi:sugar lactone lactonase YvrE/DNA-binding IclR family transcriptional regulator [Aminobacter lissarensis]|uniref:Sugar lactone lactonase YvrE/DNA-binding IclR family transcriptional regulator n=1 Tax=Aminobacter carboxidus TaxID=376165 RepID=A0A8E1WKW7_9HYPH|nr:SMP-30/gluconolactonase/LRE family protein [Aminobacter lissarensis]MBB6469829.1 sugar lactone lactonase YvrE/DNA-binding IclR family transcriptional regulator [Aminobacter lissarensis]